MDSTIKLIASDMGGVLALHSDHGLESRLLEDFGLSRYRSFAELDPRLPALLFDHSKNLISEEELWEAFTAITSIAVPEHETSLWGKYFCPELDSAVETLYREVKGRGHRLVCATNTEPAHYVYHREHGHYSLFDAVYASCEMGHAKPEREYFDYILEHEQVNAEEVLFIDDMEENCESAANLGIRAYLFKDVVELRWSLVGMDII